MLRETGDGRGFSTACWLYAMLGCWISLFEIMAIQATRGPIDKWSLGHKPPSLRSFLTFSLWNTHTHTAKFTQKATKDPLCGSHPNFSQAKLWFPHLMSRMKSTRNPNWPILLLSYMFLVLSWTIHWWS